MSAHLKNFIDVTRINKPIGFCILTCENLDQAQVRSDPNKKNKGAEVAKACLDILLDEQ